MSSLLMGLCCIEILSADLAINLRNYIAYRNPFLSPVKKAVIFSDAVNRIVDRKLPKFCDALVKKVKSFLYEDIILKSSFSINCADVFKASVKLRTLNGDFFTAIGNWLSDALNKDVARDSLFSFVEYACKLMETQSDNKLDDIITLAEQNTGGLKFMNTEPERPAVEAAIDINCAILDLEDIPANDIIEDKQFVNKPGSSGAILHRKAGLFDTFMVNFLLLPKIVIAISVITITISLIITSGHTNDAAVIKNGADIYHLVSNDGAIPVDHVSWIPANPYR